MRSPYTAPGHTEPAGSIRAPERYAGYAVCDPRGQKIGRAEECFLNGSGEPEYIRVKMGFFGLKTVLIPVQAIAADEVRRTIVLQ
jgi:hypothetical protein